MIYRELQQNAVVFNEGDVGDHMLILVEGSLAIFKGGELGRHLLSYEGRGRVVGEMALLDQERRSATCVASADCVLLTFDITSLDQLSRENPAIAYRFMAALARLLSRRLRRTSGMLVEYLGDVQ
jgi:CRP-like cAMP-binding protein